MPRTKVTRNRQVTIPAEIASKAHISEGDILNVEVVDERVIFQKARDEFPVIRANRTNRKLTDDKIERLIAEAAAEISG
ncbi:MAG: AbrB/MazE/SpoVT family DNA-binding domain-containing protein [Nitrososphaerales archaeon]|nr:AbrB/MazE/SpoVT family DNA-binding domain-containing protein [Nitrososphaerales archaeon]